MIKYEYPLAPATQVNEVIEEMMEVAAESGWLVYAEFHGISVVALATAELTKLLNERRDNKEKS